MKNFFLYLSWLSMAGVLYSCTSTKRATPYFDTGNGLYTSSFPTKDVSDQLVTIEQSIQRITSTAYYTTYFFDDKNIDLSAVNQHKLKNLAVRTGHLDHSQAGTAISILQNNSYIAFVTANHVVQFPDTLISYKKGLHVPKDTFLSSVSIKNKQRTYLFTPQKFFELNVSARNNNNDLALLIATRKDGDFYAPPLKLKTGAAKKLKVGSFLYILGYPLGSAMVTRGIVSAPNYDDHGEFLTDALFNHGISGGLIIATRNNFESFEWVGMAAQASASEEVMLIPNPNTRELYRNLDAYTDTAYVKKKKSINYGLAQATPIEKILLFLYSNEDVLKKYGLSSLHISGQHQ